ncbi:MAG: alpha/beta hydrolase [Candidatus Limnocylindrus sp.]|jgi:arylformamidase
MFAMLHGGWWQEGSIDDAGRYAQIVTDAGGIHLSIGYTLAPHVTLGGILDEVATAIDAIATHAEQLGGNPLRFVLGGHSAGAHLAAMLVTAGAGRVSDDVRGRITGLMLISGVYDLAPIVESYVNDAVRMGEQDALQLSPALFEPLRDIPVHVAVGAREPEEFHRNAALLTERWSPYLRDLASVTIADRDHFDILEEMDTPGGALVAPLLRLLGLPVRGYDHA